MDVSKLSIGFIGGGMMAEAIAKGLLEKSVLRRDQVRISEPYPPRKEYLVKEGWTLMETNAALVEWADVVFLAVKPNVIHTVIRETDPSTAKSVLFISIAAGVTLESLESITPGRYVRVMPNTPCLVGAGASAVSGGEKEDVAVAMHLMSAVGTAVEAPEYQIDAVTGISGSGPAYVYIFIESLADAGVQQGLSRAVAHELAVQTVYGAAKMVQVTGEHPAQLRNKVESPGGTTIAAVRALEASGLRNAIYSAVEACIRRVKEMRSKM